MKRFLLIFVLLLSSVYPAFAQKIPVRITPAQIISTNHDETQVGDWIKFKTLNDIYLDNKLYIKKGTSIVGVVDYVHDNGWMGDSADITFKKFITHDINNKTIEIPYMLKIKGDEFVEGEKKQFATLVVYAFDSLAFLIRGAEINIEPDERTYNLFIEQ